MTTYVVTGYMRSGTSMMMHALEAGGLEAAFSNREHLNTKFGDEHYQPNPDGFYELKREEYQQPGFPRMYEGKLIKMLMGGVPRIVAGDYKIVFMRRDFEEIRQSYEAFFGIPPRINAEEYDQRVADTLGILRQRKDVYVQPMQYRDVVEEPELAFGVLRGQGWPIDEFAAAGVVDSAQCRFRIEELAIGA